MYRKPVNKVLNILSDISLSCNNYILLAEKNIQEFSKKSIICLDTDVKENRIKNLKSIILLPGEIPPDQLIFEFLYNLQDNDGIWTNAIHYTKAVFNNSTNAIRQDLSITGQQINLKNVLKDYYESNSDTTKPRESFKKFYKAKDFQDFLKQKENPWKHWIDKNQDVCDEFIEKFTNMVIRIMKQEYDINEAKLSFLKKGDKK